MKSIEIKDKNNNQYTIKIDEKFYEKDVVENQQRWKVEHKIYNQSGELIGHGHFSATCDLEHEHLPDDKMFDMLTSINIEKVKEDINNGNDIESKGYNLHVSDCTK